MLLDSKYTIVPSLRFCLTYDNGVRKVITVKTKDTINCTYRKNGEVATIEGLVAKIGCNFNSSLGTVGTTAYLQVDGSSEYSGLVEYIQPNQILDIVIISTTGEIHNVVCSVDNEDQRISLIRENEVGVFQYSLDGITWRAANGAQGMSAYECAVALGFVGTEEEWLASLKGEKGEPGEPGALEVYAVFSSVREAERERFNVPKGKLIIISLDKAVLFVRNSTNDDCTCGCRCCCDDGEIIDSIKVKGYDYVGTLSVGPQGPKGDPGIDGRNGKSAYQYAVDGGFTLSEEEFTDILSRAGTVAVTNFYMGPTSNTLHNTVVGPIDLRIFGYTNITTFRSKYIERIDISNPTELEDQTIIFPEPIVLRAVPASSEASKPNIIIKDRKYVADCIMKKDGKVGIFRRIKYIQSYNGETILGDWISSTGQLDMGARVQFVTYGFFEPFPEIVQSQYKKLHTYDNSTTIDVTDGSYMTVTYPINVSKYIEQYVDEKVVQYLEEKAPEVIVPIVEREVADKLATKQDKLIAGENITISANNVISSSANTVLKQDITATVSVGGVEAGTVIPAGTQLADILKMVLSPDVPPPPPEDSKVYFGVTDSYPTSIDGLTPEVVDIDDVIANGITHRYTADNQFFVYAYKKSMGELISIKDPSGFENLDGWNHIEYTGDSGTTYYIYYTKENLTVTSYKLNFIYTD